MPKSDEHARRVSTQAETETGPGMSPDQSQASHDDVALIAACVRDNQNAWRELVTRFSRLVYSIPRRYGLDDQSCDDVFQTVFANLSKRLADLRDPRSLPKWLITTAHRATWRILRERIRDAAAAVHDGERVDADAPAPDRVLQWERQHMVRQALIRLGGRCQALLEALYLDPAKPSYEQISQRMDIPVGGIGPTRSRCLAKLSEICEVLGLE